MRARPVTAWPAAAALAVWMLTSSPACGQNPLKKLPPGWKTVQHTDVPAEQVSRIAASLGARIVKLSNTLLETEGKTLQVNIAECPNEAEAEKAHAAFLRAHGGSHVYALKNGRTVIELCKCSDVPLVIKAPYVLGLMPRTVTYRVTFDAAPLETCDDMAWNRMFNAFLAWRKAPKDPEALNRIAALRPKFEFGARLRLRTCGLGKAKSRYAFRPKPTGSTVAASGDTADYTFADLPRKAGVPCVAVTATVTSTAFAVVPTQRKAGPELLGPTPFWPSDDAEIAALAKKVTAGAGTPEKKVRAILAWLMPGRHIKFGGPVTGSRYGVKQTLKQGFGHCWDFSDLCIVLCRASGVPARQVAGWLHGECGHVWAEVLIDGKGWQQVDPTAGTACTSRYIPYLTSETGRMPMLYLSMPTIAVLRAK